MNSTLSGTNILKTTWGEVVKQYNLSPDTPVNVEVHDDLVILTIVIPLSAEKSTSGAKDEIENQ